MMSIRETILDFVDCQNLFLLIIPLVIVWVLFGAQVQILLW